MHLEISAALQCVCPCIPGILMVLFSHLYICKTHESSELEETWAEDDEQGAQQRTFAKELLLEWRGDSFHVTFLNQRSISSWFWTAKATERGPLLAQKGKPWCSESSIKCRTTDGNSCLTTSSADNSSFLVNDEWNLRRVLFANRWTLVYRYNLRQCAATCKPGLFDCCILWYPCELADPLITVIWLLPLIGFLCACKRAEADLMWPFFFL